MHIGLPPPAPPLPPSCSLPPRRSCSARKPMHMGLPLPAPPAPQALPDTPLRQLRRRRQGCRLCHAACTDVIVPLVVPAPVHVLHDALVEPPQVAGRHATRHALFDQACSLHQRARLLHLTLTKERICESTRQLLDVVLWAATDQLAERPSLTVLHLGHAQLRGIAMQLPVFERLVRNALLLFHHAQKARLGALDEVAVGRQALLEHHQRLCQEVCSLLQKVVTRHEELRDVLERLEVVDAVAAQHRFSGLHNGGLNVACVGRPFCLQKVCKRAHRFEREVVLRSVHPFVSVDQVPHRRLRIVQVLERQHQCHQSAARLQRERVAAPQHARALLQCRGQGRVRGVKLASMQLDHPEKLVSCCGCERYGGARLESRVHAATRPRRRAQPPAQLLHGLCMCLGLLQDVLRRRNLHQLQRQPHQQWAGRAAGLGLTPGLLLVCQATAQHLRLCEVFGFAHERN
mmetsp:Transcript_19917/g.59144  ORF Transcript_19917/g.59144 Transcript_19917/m.59144 type:complete len:460 (+) Transcript_19917:1866-3245(+)